MPGPQIRNWDQYHALRREGKSKESAAKITNAAIQRRLSPPAKRGQSSAH